jgi:CheY-like chemotaxis protein
MESSSFRPGPQADHPTILIVDDDDVARDAMQLLLELDGFRVVTATDGEQGLAQLRAGLKPLAILLDLCMPRMDGFEFRLAQAQEPRLADIPVVVYSAQIHTAERIAVLKPTAYLEKPFNIERLRSIFAQLSSAASATRGS